MCELVWGERRKDGEIGAGTRVLDVLVLLLKWHSVITPPPERLLL